MGILEGNDCMIPVATSTPVAAEANAAEKEGRAVIFRPDAASNSRCHDLVITHGTIEIFICVTLRSSFEYICAPALL